MNELLKHLGLDLNKLNPGQTIILIVQDDKSLMVIFEPPLEELNVRT